MNANNFPGKRKKINGIMKLSIPVIKNKKIAWEWCNPPNCHKQLERRLREIIKQKKLSQKTYRVIVSGQKVTVVKKPGVNFFGIFTYDKEWQPADFISYLNKNN